MDGLEKIKQRILEEAKLEAQKLIKEAETKACSIKEEQNEKALKLKLKLANEAKSNADDHKKRLIAAALLDMKKDKLSAKRQMLDEAFKESIVSIRELPLSVYSEAIRSMLLALNIQGGTEIIFSKEDKENFGNGFIDEINAVYKAIGNDMRLKLSSEIGEFQGGFILKTKEVEINNTLETLLKLVRDEVEPLAAKILFAERSDRKEDL